MIVIDKYAGLATNASPYSLPPGAAVTQVNVQVLVPGQIQVREGLTTVSWTTHTGATEPIVRAIHFQHSTFPQVVYQNADGGLYVAKGPV